MLPYAKDCPIKCPCTAACPAEPGMPELLATDSPLTPSVRHASRFLSKLTCGSTRKHEEEYVATAAGTGNASRRIITWQVVLGE